MIIPGLIPPMTDEEEKETRRRIDKAKIALMMEPKTTFFSSLLSTLKLEMNREKPTAATNAITLWVNPDFVRDLNTDEMMGLLLHETMHVALDHCNFEIYKRDNCNPKILNIAMDHYINNYITAQGYVIPPDGYCDPKYAGMSSMEIYNDLMKDPPPESELQMVQCDVEGAPEDMDPDEYNEVTSGNIIKAVLQAEMADDYGSIPGDIQRKVKALLSPELPWNVILLKHVDTYAKDDFSWQRPNRRYSPDYYLPCMRSDRISQVTFGQDVSGSMSEDDIAEGRAECNHIIDLLQPEHVRFMTFDTKVHINDMLGDGEYLPEAELEGGGGTNVRPLLESIREENPVFAIIFTDGYFGTPDMSDIQSDIYWVIKGNPGFTAPKGEVIHLN